MLAAITTTITTTIAACGPQVEEIDIAGVYKVDEAVGSMPCSDTDFPVAAPAYVKFESSAGGYKYTGCTDASGASCMSLGIVETFDEAIDGGWRNRDTYVSSSAGECFMGYFEMAATREDDKLIFERFIYEETKVPQATCSHEEALRRGEMMPCVDHTKWTMTQQ